MPKKTPAQPSTPAPTGMSADEAKARLAAALKPARQRQTANGGTIPMREATPEPTPEPEYLAHVPAQLQGRARELHNATHATPVEPLPGTVLPPAHGADDPPIDTDPQPEDGAQPAGPATAAVAPLQIATEEQPKGKAKAREPKAPEPVLPRCIDCLRRVVQQPAGDDWRRYFCSYACLITRAMSTISPDVVWNGLAMVWAPPSDAPTPPTTADTTPAAEPEPEVVAAD